MKTPVPLFRRYSPAFVPPLAVLTLLLAVTRPAIGQESAWEGDGEYMELSPFSVSSAEDRGYVSGSAFGGTRARAAVPAAPITLVRRADAVVIEFAVSNTTDKQAARNQELTDAVEQITALIKATPGLRFENREVQLATGNRRSFIGKGGAVTSFANFAVFAEISDSVRLYERVKQVRGLVSGVKLKGETKVLDGPVALFLKRPNETRTELLAKIFADLEIVKKGLGSDFQVLVSGLAGPVQLRSCSESEVELWLDYSFTIQSLREIESRRPVKT
jgi:hypothetical protein